ncbi:MAG: redox-regulated ATPase YchF [Planctomycetes bacterium]|nr:redox-regulated ATPase YchF [Planctomycetota bacterium]
MRIAIIGLPQSGKTTLFDAITGRRDEPGAYAAPGSLHVGVVPVLDGRVDRLAAILQPRKHTYAALEFEDIGGLFTGDRPSPEAVAAMRQADCFVKVVRAFEREDLPHLRGSIDPRRDLEEIGGELFVTDLDIIERRTEALRVSVRHPTPKQEEEKAELALLERCRAQLDSAGALDRLTLSDDERKALRGYTFLTQKPAVVVLNIGEGQIGDEVAQASGLCSTPAVALCADMEKELLALEPEERKPFMDALGLAELRAPRVVEAALQALGLISFFTSNEKELRAWLLPRGATAVEGAGKVHTDLARGFIRSEVVAADDLLALGSLKEVKAHGKLRLEGKDYVVQDGDLLQIRFSV